MAFLWLIIGLVIGAAGAYYYFVYRVDEEGVAPLPGVEENMKNLLAAIDSCFEVSFPRFGMPGQTRTDAFNKLWGMTGHELKGYPEQ